MVDPEPNPNMAGGFGDLGLDEGIEGGIPGGVVGGVVGGVLGGEGVTMGSSSSSYEVRTEIDFSDVDVDGDLVKPEGAYVVSDDEVAVVMRQKPRVRLPKVPKIGASKRAAAPPPPPPPPSAAPIPPPMVEPSPVAAGPPAEPNEPVSTGTVMTKEFLEKIPAGRSYQSAVPARGGKVSGRKGRRDTTDDFAELDLEDMEEEEELMVVDAPKKMAPGAPPRPERKPAKKKEKKQKSKQRLRKEKSEEKKINF